MRAQFHCVRNGAMCIIVVSERGAKGTHLSYMYLVLNFIFSTIQYIYRNQETEAIVHVEAM